MLKLPANRVILSVFSLIVISAIVLSILAWTDQLSFSENEALPTTSATPAAVLTETHLSTSVTTVPVNSITEDASAASESTQTTTQTTTKATTQSTTKATTAPKPTTVATTTVPTTTAPPKSYAGLLWYAMGDSITNSGLYPDVLVRNMGFRYYYNDGVPATKMSVMADRITASKLATFDLATVFAGTNDYGEDTPLGSPGDSAAVDSFYGHVQKVIDKVRTAKPGIELVFLTPIIRGAYATQPVHPAPNVAGFTLDDYRKAIKSVCAANGVKVIDLYATSGITLDNVSTYTSDNLHPNWDGAALIAQAIQRGLER